MNLPYYAPEPHVLGWLRDFILPADRVLDVGSGDGRHHNLGAAEYVSLDSWIPAKPDYLMDLNQEDLPVDREFDVILCIDVIEHLPRDRGEAILNQAMQLSKRAVIVLVPLEWNENREIYDDPKGFYYKNDHILHQSKWELSDFPGWNRVILPSTENNFFGYRMSYE